MQIEINADRNIQHDALLSRRVDELVRSRLARFADRITRVEVYLSNDSHAVNTGEADKRCVLETRLAGHQPVTATDTAETIEQATNAASKKMLDILDSIAAKPDGR